MLKNGHSALLNETALNAKYDWILKLDVGKRITWVKKDLFENKPKSISAYMMKEFENEKDAWFSFYNKEKAHWVKYVHETIEPFEGYANSNDVIYEFSRIGQDVNYDWSKQYKFENEYEKRACEMYRQLSRIKWVALDDINIHPGRDVAIQAYKEHALAYHLNREDLMSYLMNYDLNAGM